MVTRVLLVSLLIVFVMDACSSDESSHQVKISLYKLYLTSKDYDSLKIDIPQIKVKSDLIDSTEYVSFFQGKGWHYESIDEFKVMRVQSAYVHNGRYEINLISILKDQKSREESLVRHSVVYTKKDSAWVLTKHKMWEEEPLEKIMKALRADSLRADSLKLVEDRNRGKLNTTQEPAK